MNEKVQRIHFISEKGKQLIRISSDLSDEREEGPGRGEKRPISTALQEDGTNLVYQKEIDSFQHLSTISESTKRSNEEAKTVKEHWRYSMGVQGSSKSILEGTSGATL